jgi:hypothetical protein
MDKKAARDRTGFGNMLSPSDGRAGVGRRSLKLVLED